MNKNKIGINGWIQNGRVADSNGGLICSPHTNYQLPKKKILVHEITRACRYVCVCVCVCLHSYVRMMYLIMCILMYLLVYLCMMYVYSKYNRIFVESPVHISCNVPANTTCVCVFTSIYIYIYLFVGINAYILCLDPHQVPRNYSLNLEYTKSSKKKYPGNHITEIKDEINVKTYSTLPLNFRQLHQFTIFLSSSL
jgi:hypothetical protein